MRQEIGKIEFLAEKRIFSESVWLDVLFYRIFMGRRIDSMSQTTNWAPKHHFMVGKTKKTYLSDCENSHEKEQTGRFCELKPCFYLLLSG